MQTSQETRSGSTRRALAFFVLGIICLALFLYLLISGVGDILGDVIAGLLTIIFFVVARYEMRVRTSTRQRAVLQNTVVPASAPAESSAPPTLDAQPITSEPPVEVHEAEAPAAATPAAPAMSATETAVETPIEGSPVPEATVQQTEASPVLDAQPVLSEPSIGAAGAASAVAASAAPVMSQSETVEEAPVEVGHAVDTALEQPASAPVLDAQPAVSAPVIEVYCVKCKKKVTMQNPERITMKNGRPAMQGTCPVCGSKVFRIGRF